MIYNTFKLMQVVIYRILFIKLV